MRQIEGKDAELAKVLTKNLYLAQIAKKIKERRGPLEMEVAAQIRQTTLTNQRVARMPDEEDQQICNEMYATQNHEGATNTFAKKRANN